VNDPEVLLADEPTGNLDTTMGAEVVQVIARLNRERGITVLIVTHDPSVAARARRDVALRDGRIVADVRRPVS
jgi:predicted ABC-type transport system involved in lysophospholipase L1 biosynthesis ATPase subunit